MKECLRVMLAVTILLACIVPLTFFVSTGGIAHAASCYKDGCDNTDPIATGCASGTVTTDQSSNILNASGTVIGVLQVRLSHASPHGCNSVWTRVISDIGTASVYAYIASYRTGTYSDITYNGTTAYTNQFGRDGSFDIYGCINDFCGESAYS